MTSLFEDDVGNIDLHTNEEYAKRYEHNKRRAELDRLKEKYPDLLEDDSEEELSTDDEEGELATPSVDAAILNTLAKIKSKDASVYEKERSIFDEEESKLGKAGVPQRQRKENPVYLKDYQRERLMENVKNGGVPDEEPERPLTHAEEDAKLKQETKAAFMGADGDEDLLTLRETQNEEDPQHEKFVREHTGDKVLQAAFSKEEEFLRDYLLNRQWLEKNETPTYKQVVGGDEDDEEFDEEAEEFENEYNNRYEEGGILADENAELKTYARSTANEASLRKPSAIKLARRRARERIAQRKEEERVARREEVRRLRALQRQELTERLEQIAQAAGSKPAQLDENLEKVLEGDFDPAKYDEAMSKLYGEGYDEQSDDGWNPQDDAFELSDSGDSDAESKGNGANGSTKSASGSTKNASGSTKNAKDTSSDDLPGSNLAPRDLIKKAASVSEESTKEELRKARDAYLELDYEDKIGDLKTRFRYIPVAKPAVDITPADILSATDAQLNEFQSLKKLAPYRAESGKAKNLSFRLRQLRAKLQEAEDVPKKRHSAEDKKIDRKKRKGKKERQKERKSV